MGGICDVIPKPVLKPLSSGRSAFECKFCHPRLRIIVKLEWKVSRYIRGVGGGRKGVNRCFRRSLSPMKNYILPFPLSLSQPLVT